MTAITITLPDELAKEAQDKGLLSSEAIEAYVREKLREANGKDVDARLAGLVSPGAFRKGTIVGDIVGPFHEEWEGRQ